MPMTPIIIRAPYKSVIVKAAFNMSNRNQTNSMIKIVPPKNPNSSQMTAKIKSDSRTGKKDKAF